MEINYILLAHKSPKQIKRLLDRLNEPWVRFYIHLDKKIDKAPFVKILSPYPNVFILKNMQRQPGTWGDIGIVKGTLNAMEQIVLDKRTGYCVLLSGQDYPLRSNETIRDCFKQKYDTSYISLFPMPHPNWYSGGLDRIKKYKINKSFNRGHFLLLPSLFEKDFYSMETAGKINFLFKAGKYQEIKLIFKKRSFPGFLKPYGGGQWWALPIQTVKDILHFLNERPSYLEYHTYTLLPDEIFFHSIIMYLYNKKLLKIEPSLTYVNWERTSGPLPVTFKKDDFTELLIASRDKLFARKFDLNMDSEILDEIDTKLINS